MSLSQVIPFRPNTRIEFALIHEANHRVANHLTLLAGMVQVQASNLAKGPELISRDDVQAILREVAGKVIGIGQLHRKLSDLPHDQTIDLGDYLIESSHTLVKMLAPRARIGIVHRLMTKCPARAEQVQPVALIVGEVIMNAIKHAHPTGLPIEISIYCGRDTSGRTVVEIEDDGIGLPENFDTKKGGGVGLRLIRRLAESLLADLEIASDSLGTRFRLTLPHDPGTSSA